MLGPPASGAVPRRLSEHPLLGAASDIGGVVEKLTIWWGEGLFDDSYESRLNRTVIGDLRQIELEMAGVDDMEASGRTPEEAAELVEAWRAALADYTEQERLLVEDREDASVGAVDYAAGVLLELPAPNVAGVVRKLELLWEHERYDEVLGTFCLHIIRDLHRLTRSPASIAGEAA